MKNLLLKLIQRFFLQVPTNIRIGDLVCHIDNEDLVYEAIGIYYSYALKPFLFIRDREGRIYGMPVYEYKRLNNVEKIYECN